MASRRARLSVLVIAFLSAVTYAHQDNTNLWPVHRDVQMGFLISYPPGWSVRPGRGPNVRFSVYPPDGPGNCNVVARPNAETEQFSQEALNREVEVMPNDKAAWAEFMGVPRSQIHEIETSRGRILTVPAVLGTFEATFENLQGQFRRKGMIAFTLTPGMAWSLNCGVNDFSSEVARARFATLEPMFVKMFGTFRFLQ
jgi:hypothetical protein